MMTCRQDKILPSRLYVGGMHVLLTCLPYIKWIVRIGTEQVDVVHMICIVVAIRFVATKILSLFVLTWQSKLSRKLELSWPIYFVFLG